MCPGEEAATCEGANRPEGRLRRGLGSYLAGYPWVGGGGTSPQWLFWIPIALEGQSLGGVDLCQLSLVVYVLLLMPVVLTRVEIRNGLLISRVLFWEMLRIDLTTSGGTSCFRNVSGFHFIAEISIEEPVILFRRIGSADVSSITIWPSGPASKRVLRRWLDAIGRWTREGADYSGLDLH